MEGGKQGGVVAGGLVCLGRELLYWYQKLRMGTAQSVPPSPALTEEDIAELRVLFETIDEDGSGDLDRDEVQQLLRNLGASERVFPSSAVLDFEDFLELMARLPRINGALPAPKSEAPPVNLRASRKVARMILGSKEDERGEEWEKDAAFVPHRKRKAECEEGADGGSEENASLGQSSAARQKAHAAPRSKAARTSAAAGGESSGTATAVSPSVHPHSPAIEVSRMERQPSRQTLSMTRGTARFRGIMCEANAAGEPNRPFDHQKEAVSQIAEPSTTFYILAHDMGLGKTATALQAYCAEAVRLGRVPKMVVTAPSAVLDQWHQTITDWVRIDGGRVLVASSLSSVSEAALRKVDILVISRDLLARAYATCFVRYEQHHKERSAKGHVHWVAQWDRIGATGVTGAMGAPPPLHCLLAPPTDAVQGWRGVWDMMVVDEAHYMRNPCSRWCESHAQLSTVATKRVMLSGTFVVNRPLDLAGLCKAGGAPRAPIDFQSPSVWQTDGGYRHVNKDAVAALQRAHVNRQMDTILDLPPVHRVAVTYDVSLPRAVADTYNGCLQEARSLKKKMSDDLGGGRHKQDGDVVKLMRLLCKMQQYVVSPLLAEKGAAAFQSAPELLDQAAQQPTAAMHALLAELDALHAAGHARVVVAADHVVKMRIAARWLERHHPHAGRIFFYDGSLSQPARRQAKEAFLSSARGVLFLSIKAGGVGLHLVPGCEAMVFWGSMPFSPAHTRQALKRIHRIGQECPTTGAVTIVHLVPHGSVDFGIGRVHHDKERLIELVQEGDASGFGEHGDDQWRKYGRIVDECMEMGEDGNFPPMPLVDPADKSKPFALLGGRDVTTRGRDASSVARFVQQAAVQSAKASPGRQARRRHGASGSASGGAAASHGEDNVAEQVSGSRCLVM